MIVHTLKVLMKHPAKLLNFVQLNFKMQGRPDERAKEETADSVSEVSSIHCSDRGAKSRMDGCDKIHLSH